MKIDYSKILQDNMLNVLRDVLKNIEKNGLGESHHLYITFKTNNKNVIMPNWLKDKFPNEMTIVIQYEYWNFKLFKNYFKITLSFNNIKSNLEIPFKSVISFADPYANFGLKLFDESDVFVTNSIFTNNNSMGIGIYTAIPILDANYLLFWNNEDDCLENCPG